MTIDGYKKFVERLVAGEQINLYRYNRGYVLKADSALIFFGRKDFRSVVASTIKCEGNDPTLSKLTYSRVALSNFFDQYNHGVCNPHGFPHRKAGVYAGLNIMEVSATVENFGELSDQTLMPVVGLFFDWPLHIPRFLFVTTELNWAYGRALLYREDNNRTNFSGLKVNAINSLLSAKWMLNRNKVRTFLKTGALVSYVNTTSPTGLVETVSRGSSIDIQRYDVVNATNFMLGYNAGLGLEIPYKHRKNFHAEVRYLKTFNATFDRFKIDMSAISVVVGFNI